MRKAIRFHLPPPDFFSSLVLMRQRRCRMAACSGSGGESNNATVGVGTTARGGGAAGDTAGSGCGPAELPCSPRGGFEHREQGYVGREEETWAKKAKKCCP